MVFENSRNYVSHTEVYIVIQANERPTKYIKHLIIPFLNHIQNKYIQKVPEYTGQEAECEELRKFYSKEPVHFRIWSE